MFLGAKLPAPTLEFYAAQDAMLPVPRVNSRVLAPLVKPRLLVLCLLRALVAAILAAMSVADSMVWAEFIPAD